MCMIFFFSLCSNWTVPCATGSRPKRPHTKRTTPHYSTTQHHATVPAPLDSPPSASSHLQNPSPTRPLSVPRVRAAGPRRAAVAMGTSLPPKEANLFKVIVVSIPASSPLPPPPNSPRANPRVTRSGSARFGSPAI
jgi:hypothetical protein